MNADLFAALDRGHAGASAAADHADAVEPGWTEMAVDDLRRFARTATRPFTIEQARAHCLSTPQGCDARAWGGRHTDRDEARVHPLRGLLPAGTVVARVDEADVRAGRAGMSESPCLGCNAIETHPVTLDSGHVVCSSCEAYRHECEVRAVVGMPGQRRTYLEGVTKQRGPAAARRLEQDVRDELARLKTNGGRTA